MIRWGLIFLTVAFLSAVMGYGALLASLKKNRG